MDSFTWFRVPIRIVSDARSGNHAHAVAPHLMYYNFVRIHKTLHVTPAMAAGVTDKLWEIRDVVAMLEKWEAAD